jgi:hypothetical protein
MHTFTIRRIGVALLAAASLSAATASLPSVSHAEPNNGSGGTTAKQCHLPGGKTIDSGTSGTDYGTGGKTYSCNDGVACQVENGKTTTKCSHTERAAVRSSRPSRVSLSKRA